MVLEWCLLISCVLAYTAYMEATRSLGTEGTAPFHEVLTVHGPYCCQELTVLMQGHARKQEWRKLKGRTLDRDKRAGEG